jgi:hypothetical protein
MRGVEIAAAVALAALLLATLLVFATAGRWPAPAARRPEPGGHRAGGDAPGSVGGPAGEPPAAVRTD